MKTLEYVPVPAFEDNYIWLVSDGRDAVVVDPGDAGPVEAYLAKRGWRLTAILLTHHHHDHVGGVEELLAGRSDDGGIPVYGPAGERIDHLSARLKEGDRVRIESPALEVSVIDVPGHTAGHIAYFQAADSGGTPHLFCGDTLFASGCGRLTTSCHERRSRRPRMVWSPNFGFIHRAASSEPVSVPASMLGQVFSSSQAANRSAKDNDNTDHAGNERFMNDHPLW